MSGQTIGAALGRTRAALEKAKIDSAALDARLLLAAALGCPVETIMARPERAIADDGAARLSALLDRRLRREPMAYILGRREFWSLDFEVTPDVLIPRPDTETVVDAVLGRFPDRNAPLRILDLGVGSGCLLLSLLHEFRDATGVGVDCSAPALDIAARNAIRLGLGPRASFIPGDWTTTLGDDVAFELIVSNPPYIRSAEIAQLAAELTHEPRVALDGGPDGLSAYRAIAAQARRLAAPGGLLALEIGQGQAADVEAILAESGWRLAGGRADLAGVARAVLARNPALSAGE